MRRSLAAAACGLVLLTGCGSDDPVPSVADLDRNGTLWATLDGDDKLVLVSQAKDRVIQADPTLVGDIRAYTGVLLRNRLDRFYAQPENRSVPIYRAYRLIDRALVAEQDRIVREAG